LPFSSKVREIQNGVGNIIRFLIWPAFSYIFPMHFFFLANYLWTDNVKRILARAYRLEFSILFSIFSRGKRGNKKFATMSRNCWSVGMSEMTLMLWPSLRLSYFWRLDCNLGRKGVVDFQDNQTRGHLEVSQFLFFFPIIGFWSNFNFLKGRRKKIGKSNQLNIIWICIGRIRFLNSFSSFHIEILYVEYVFCHECIRYISSIVSHNAVCIFA